MSKEEDVGPVLEALIEHLCAKPRFDFADCKQTYETLLPLGGLLDRMDKSRAVFNAAADEFNPLIAQSGELVRSNLQLQAKVRELEERLRSAEQNGWILDGMADYVDWPSDVVHLQDDENQLSEADPEDVFEQIEDACRALRAERKRQRLTLHNLTEGVVTTDSAGIVDYLNPVAETLTGMTRTEAQGQHISRVLRLHNEFSGAPVPSDLWQRCLSEGRPIQSDDTQELTSHEGATFDIDYSVVPIHMQDGQSVGITVIMRDVTRSRRMARQMAHEATHDPLTGLVNRREFERRLAQALANAESHHAVHIFAYLDLDDFSNFNETAGHDAGDRLLRLLKANIAPSFRERDTFARLGDDEFGLLLENCALKDGIRVCENVLACIRRSPLVYQDRIFSITASIGLVAIAEGGCTPAELLAWGERASATGREQGGDRVVVFEGDDISSRRHRDISRVTVLRNALDRNRLRLYFQPIVPLQDQARQPAGVEILLRCLDANGDLIMPSALIPAAERYGLMRAVDRWVIERSCQFLADARRRMSGTAESLGHLAINLSGSSVGDETLPDFLRQQFAAYNLPAEHFCFEITETCAIHNLDLAAAFVRELQRIGCTVALDDFGSGLSSFSYLKALPVDFVKIDGSFVKDMLDNPVDHAVVVAVKKIAAMMGVRCIAEYVHSNELLRCLRGLSVDFAQGNAVGAALPLEVFDRINI